MARLLKNNLISFTNPSVKPCEVNTELRIASLTLSAVFLKTGGRLTTEEMARQGQLYSIACHMSGAGIEKEICFMLGEQRETRPDNLEIFPTEQGVLNAFIEWFKEEDPDIVIGWHVIGFDSCISKLSVNHSTLILILAEMAKAFLPLSSWRRQLCHYIRKGCSGWPSKYEGRRIHIRRLQARNCLAGTSCSEGKIITASKEDKIAEIEDSFANDKDMLSKYNIQTASL